MYIVNSLQGFNSKKPPSKVNYLQKSISGTDTSTYTFASQNIGTASAKRWIVVGASFRSSGSTTANSLTVGGLSATRIVSGSNTSNEVGLWVVPVPTGTTADVVYSLSSGAVRAGIFLWEVHTEHDLTRPVSTFGSTGTTMTTSTIETAPGGYVFGFCEGVTTTGTAALAWSGLTELDEGTMEVSNNVLGAGGAVFPAGGNVGTLTITLSGGALNEGYYCFAGIR